MTHTAPPQDVHQDNHLIVEDVVSALTGQLADETTQDIGLQMERAAEEFDKRTANAFGKALLDSLCDDPGNLRQLEALLILGLAHPDVLESHRISLAVEGRRLAVLLERSGEPERARTVLELLSSRLPSERTIDHELAGLLRRSGHTDELVERYLARAEKAVEEGHVAEAIPWLQEVLLLDRTRRDVARMIRDLRYQEAEREARRSRRNRVMAVVIALTAVVTIVVAREIDLHRKFGLLPAAEEGNLKALQARHDAIEEFIGDHRVWAGLFGATGERSDLRARIAELKRAEERERAEKESRRRRDGELAEAARQRGLLYTERGDFPKALRDFERALDLGGPQWEHREQIERDIAALREWKEAQGE